MRSNASVGCDLLIAGAGPAGTIAAAQMARAGFDVLLVDKAVFPRDKLCGDFQTPGSVRLLESSGMVDAALAARPVFLSGMNLVFDRTVVSLPFPAGTRGWALGRRDLDDGLLRVARMAGARVVEGCRVDSVAGAGGGILASAFGREMGPITIEARFAIDAGGRNAVTPRRRGWRRPARWPVRYAVGAWFENVRGLGDRGEMHVLEGGRGGYIGISPIGRGVAGAAAVVSGSVLESFKHDTAELLLRMIRSSGDLRARFSSARAVTPTRGAGPLAHGATRLGEDRLLIAGDAAAFVDPFTGEGIQAALLGGLLAAKTAGSVLRGTAAPPAATREYERELRRSLGPRFAVARSIQALLASPPLARRVALALSRREDLASSIIAVTGGCAPPRSLLAAGFLWPLMIETAGRNIPTAPAPGREALR